MLKMLPSTFYISSDYLRNFPQELVWCENCVFTVTLCSKLDEATGQLN